MEILVTAYLICMMVTLVKLLHTVVTETGEDRMSRGEFLGSFFWVFVPIFNFFAALYITVEFIGSRPRWMKIKQWFDKPVR